MNGRPMGRGDDRRRPQAGLRINQRIRVPEVRVIADEGEQLGILPTHEALRLAEERGLDLVEIKEIKFRPKTEGHDMDFKVKHVRRFLEGGNKVRLAVVFRGREITHPQTGMKVLNRVVELCSDIATVEATPNMEGRRMIMVIAPKPGVVRKAQEARKIAIAAQIQASAQAKHGGKTDGKPAQPPPPDDPDDLDEDEINADVIDDDEE